MTKDNDAVQPTLTITIANTVTAGGTVDISIDEPSVRMAVGEPHKIEYSAGPEGAQIPELFFSSDSEFITVDEEGNITAEYEGEATITVSSVISMTIP